MRAEEGEPGNEARSGLLRVVSAECCVTQQQPHPNLTAHVRACSVGATFYTRFLGTEAEFVWLWES